MANESNLPRAVPGISGSGRRHALSLLAACCLLLHLSACGFQLRGQHGAQLPPQLSEMRVRTPSSSNILQADIERALVAQGGVRIVRDETRAATLTVLEERSQAQPSSVGRDVRVSELLLRYEVEFELTDAAGKALLGRQRISLQRGLSYDKFNVLAQERDTQETTARMREDAVQQIIRRLAALRSP